MIVFRNIVLLCCFGSPLGAQGVGVGYQVAHSDQVDTRDARGPAFRFQFHGPVELRADFVSSDGERFDYPCGGFIPPGCFQQRIHYSSDHQSLFVAGRVRLVSVGSFHLATLPEIGVIIGTITKRGLESGDQISADGGALGLGTALELSVSRLGGTALGGWIAARARGFEHFGQNALDAYQPYRELDWIESVELGISIALPRR